LEAALTATALIALLFWAFKSKRPAPGDTTHAHSGDPMFPHLHHQMHDHRVDEGRDCAPVADSTPSFDSCGPSDSGGSSND
jgi:hypothetical protein